MFSVLGSQMEHKKAIENQTAVPLLHKLRELSHLLSLMKLALTQKQLDYTAGLLEVSGTSRDSNWNLHCWDSDCFARPSLNIVSFF